MHDLVAHCLLALVQYTRSLTLHVFACRCKDLRRVQTVAIEGVNATNGKRLLAGVDVAKGTLDWTFHNSDDVPR